MTGRLRRKVEARLGVFGRSGIEFGKFEMRKLFLMTSSGVVAAGLVACGERDSGYEAAASNLRPTALVGAVALHDSALSRVLFVTSPGPVDDDDDKLELSVDVAETGHDVAAIVASVDGKRLFVLSQGDFPRTVDDDEPPRLRVFDGGADVDEGERLVRTFELEDPMQALHLDPRGEWVAAYDGAAGVTNPNQLVLLSLEGDDEEGTPLSRTIRSFGGAPVEVIFTDPLTVPVGQPRRFLVVRTDRDITLLDLSDIEAPEVTIPLPKDEDGTAYPPEQIVFDDGDPDDPTDARLGVRLGSSSDVMLIDLGDPGDSGFDFNVVSNIVDVGGTPSSIEFVRTDGGLRLAALVPGTKSAVLVDPESNLSEIVELPSAFSEMRRITTDVAEAPEDGDVALLWGNDTSIGFWSLGETSATPYRSVQTAELSFTVGRVDDVPAPNQHLKVLSSDSKDVYVLDLNKRQSFPLLTSFGAPQISVSEDGERLWIYPRSANNFSAVTLGDLSPRELFVEPGVSFVADIERADGGRAAVVLHDDATWAATLLDAEEPDSRRTAYYPALQLEGLE